MKSFALIALLLATSLSAAPVKFEAADLYKISQVSDVAVAPSGLQLLFTRNFADIATDTRQTEIWLGRITGKTLERQLLLPASAKASMPVWSPDGKRIAYVAPYLGKAQIFVMDVASGATKPVTSGKLGGDGLVWSPGGDRIAFIGRVESAPRKISGMVERPEGASWAPAPKIIDSFSYRADGAGYATPGADQIFVVAASGDSAPVQLTKGDDDQVNGGLQWSKDASRIIFSANLRPDRDLRPREADLFSISASGGGTAQALTSADGSEADPKLSPDGKWIAYTGGVETPKFYDQPSLWVMPAGGGAARNIAAGLDRPIIAAEWAPDSRSLYAFYNDAGATWIARIPLAGAAARVAGKPAPGQPWAVAGPVGGTRLYLPSSGGAWSVGGTTLAYTSLYTDRPAGLVVEHDGKTLASVDFNADWRAGKAIGKLEEIRYISGPPGPDGKPLQIEGWVQYPADFDPAKKYPLALDIHGGPNTDYGPMFSVTHQLYAAAGYIVLFTNPRGSIGYGEAFANGIDKTYPGLDHDDLMAGVDAMLKRPYVDANNLFIGGGSGGGVLTTNAIALTNRFRAAAALRPVTDWTVQALVSDIPSLTFKYWVPGTPWDNHEDFWKRSTLSKVGSVKTPTILIDGEADYRTPIAQSEAYYQALKIKGVPTEMVCLPEAGHGMGRPSQWLQSILTVVDWYEKFRAK